MSIFDRWRRSPSSPDGEDPVEMTDAEQRFGRSCPVCGGLLGKPASQDFDAGVYRQLPALRLEVQASIRPGRFHWRLSYVDGNPFQTASDVPPTDVAFEYLLCGNGHIFPSDTPMYRGGRRQQPAKPAESWSMVAAVGPTGSGKTYLMLRTLRQSLVNERFYGASDPTRMHKVELTPLEEVPMRVRGSHYRRTLSEGAPIPATNLDLEGTPYGILSELMPDLVDEILRMIRETVVNGSAHAQTWGRGTRQPLVMRTATGGESIWTGVADLPGELFTEENEFRSENTNLRLYDALVWVVDPVIADGGDGIIRNSATGHSYTDVMDGNLRPGSLATIGADRLRAERNNVQLRLGELLAGHGGKWTAGRSTTQSLAVAVNKCDLIHASLDGYLPAEWKENGTVHLGVVKYLMETATRLSQGQRTADTGATALLNLILGDHNAQVEWRIERARAVAIDLLRHYADPDRFWNLVHVGDEDEVRGDTARGQFPWLLRVPSIGEHLDTSLRADTGAKLLARDLVMSALGSGIVCGLGHVDAVHTILAKDNVDLRFFLCSPLATVPVATQADGQAALAPLDPDKTFPRVNERSAALTQLLMVVLGKARAWHQ